MSEEYKVGKGKPPLETRWPKGTSGNPRGRPPGSKNLPALLRQELLKRRPVTVDGRPQNLIKLEIIAMRVINKAMNGSLPHLRLLLEMKGLAELLKESPLDPNGSLF